MHFVTYIYVYIIHFNIIVNEIVFALTNMFLINMLMYVIKTAMFYYNHIDVKNMHLHWFESQKHRSFLL